jgi:hypothetical protein
LTHHKKDALAKQNDASEKTMLKKKKCSCIDYTIIQKENIFLLKSHAFFSKKKNNSKIQKKSTKNNAQKKCANKKKILRRVQILFLFLFAKNNYYVQGFFYPIGQI